MGDRPKDQGPAVQKPVKVKSKDRDVGAALRSIYDNTVDEAVPSEMMDLLGKLE